MKHASIIIGLVLGFAGVSIGGGLDSKSAEYLRKLNEFEAEKVSGVKKEIWIKRVQVAAALKRELTAATKRGDLDSANALKAEIVKLEGAVDLAEIKTPIEEKKEMSKREKEDALKERFVGKIWRLFDMKYEFSKNKKIVKTTDSGAVQEGWKWKIVDENTVEAEHGDGNVRHFIFLNETEGTSKGFKNGTFSDETKITLVE